MSAKKPWRALEYRSIFVRCLPPPYNKKPILKLATFLPANDTGEYLCNVTDPVFLGDPRFPLDPTNYTINGTIEHSCFASNTSVPPYTCNSPLSLKEGGCSFTCPLPSLTNDQYLGAKIMQGIVGWISWVRTSPLPKRSWSHILLRWHRRLWSFHIYSILNWDDSQKGSL